MSEEYFIFPEHQVVCHYYEEIGTPKNKVKPIHVIEYSAYEALQKELAIWKADTAYEEAEHAKSTELVTELAAKCNRYEAALGEIAKTAYDDVGYHIVCVAKKALADSCICGETNARHCPVHQ